MEYDIVPAGYGEQPYHEDMPCMQQQIQDEAEMKEAYDNTLKKHGAREALAKLKSYLCYCRLQDEMKDRLLGIDWAIDAIDTRLSELVATEWRAVA